VDTLLLDFRDTVRGLRREPLYAAAVLATLALTLGSATIVFSVVNGVLLRPLPYPEPQRLVSVREVVPISGQYPTLPANARHFEEWRRQTTAFASIAAIDWRTAALTGAGEPAQLVIVRASGTIFDVLEMPVAIGRPLTRADEQPDRPLVAVIGHRLWADRFGSDPQALGRNLVLGGKPYTIVGVAAPGAELPTFDVLSESASLSSAFAAVVPFKPHLLNPDWLGVYNYPVIGRLKAGVTLEQARAELNVVQNSVAQIAAREAHERVDLRGWIIPLEESIVGRTRLGLLLLLGAVGGVVLIACANLANLSLTRALGRMRDAAVRTALGASRGRLVASVTLEQLLLAAVGGSLGLLIARQGLVVFVQAAPVDLPRVSAVSIDARVIAFAAAMTIAAGLCVAILPAWRMARGDVHSALRAGGRGATDRGVLRLRSALLVVQVALSVALLVVTGLFVASYIQLIRVDPGFSAERVIAMEIAPVSTRYPDEKARAALYDRILAGAREVPGIASAAWTSALPLTGETWVDLIARVGDARPSSQKTSANYRFVGPEYFRTLAMPITKGRSLDERDRNRGITPAVISARAAQTLWPNEDPIGRQFTRADPDSRFEVVGVVVDGHPTALESESPLMVYVPYWYNNEGKSVLLLRSRGEAAAIANALRGVVRGVDPEIAIADVSLLRRTVDKALAGRRYQMWLFSAFGAVALMIAAVGVYATTAYGVSRRRREMNIRVALGARASQVFALVLRQSAASLAAGIIAGGVGALAIGHIVANLLFKVRPTDPLVLAGVAMLVGSVGLFTAASAARQGLRLDPAAALRDE
jgi:putative ABC transport system permease protein